MKKIKSFPLLYERLLRLLDSLNYFDWNFRRRFSRYQLTEFWKNRIEIVLQSPDNDKIEHVPQAGTIFPKYQLMHNGIKIRLGSYYDYGNTILLRENRGVHEPQEEYAFQEILKCLPPRATMMELGAYWSFYSMWFYSVIPDAVCYMVEPDPHKLGFGRLNFELNRMQGTFIRGFISDQSQPGRIPTLTVDELLQSRSISHLHILHSDIQGYEYRMLQGAQEALQQQQIDFLFISTHSNELHEQCADYLQQRGYHILCQANLDETYSWDGLIVAESPKAPTHPPIHITKRVAKTSSA